MKRICSLLLLLSLFLCSPAARAERKEIPALLRFSQVVTEREYVRSQVYVLRTYPDTANDQVDGEMRALIDEMTERGRPSLPKGPIDLMPAYLDVGATVHRTGDRWMSFLTVARIAYEREQIYTDFDARVYDMHTGKRLLLTDLFAEDSAAWDLIAQAVRDQLSAAFSAEETDGEKLDALCAKEAILQTPFTLSPAKLSLHYRADALYPGKNTLLHVNLYYSALRPLMTEKGLKVTDNSQYKMVALTYDDGGARGQTMKLIDELRKYGADATFFVVGNRMAQNHDVLCRQQDAGYAIESHNYEHVYDNLTDEKIFAWQKKFNAEMQTIIGVQPAYMRAPGGNYDAYVRAGAGLPLIQWSLVSNDVGANAKSSVYGIARTVYTEAKDGTVVLMHDIHTDVNVYTSMILPELESRNFLCVTVDELFDHYGITLEPDKVYYSCEAQAAQGQ